MTENNNDAFAPRPAACPPQRTSEMFKHVSFLGRVNVDIVESLLCRIASTALVADRVCQKHNVLY